MTNFDDSVLLATVEDAIKASSKSDSLSEGLSMSSKLGDPSEWDSLSFVSVFLAVGKTYAVELDDDDAIHFRSIGEIKELLLEILEG